MAMPGLGVHRASNRASNQQGCQEVLSGPVVQTSRPHHRAALDLATSEGSVSASLLFLFMPSSADLLIDAQKRPRLCQRT